MHKRKAFINIDSVILASMLGSALFLCISRPLFKKMRYSETEYTEGKIYLSIYTGESKFMPKSYLDAEPEEQKKMKASVLRMLQTRLNDGFVKESPDLNERMDNFFNSP